MTASQSMPACILRVSCWAPVSLVLLFLSSVALTSGWIETDSQTVVSAQPAPFDCLAVKFGLYPSGELMVTGSAILENAPEEEDCDSEAASSGVIDKHCVESCANGKDLQDY